MVEERIKFRPIKFTPMRVTPLTGPQQPFGERRMFGRREKSRAEVLPDSGGQPPCTSEDLKRFKRDWSSIVPVVAMSHLRRHSEDVLHGGRSLNVLLDTERETKDFDMYSSTPRPHASKLEASIDRMVRCDVCETLYAPIPKSAILDRKDGTPSMSSELYRVRTRTKSSFLKNDPEMDIMKKPSGLRTIRKDGITHESLEDAYAKAKYLKDQPTRMMNARQDMKRIEEHMGVEPTRRPSILMRVRRREMML